MNDPISARCHAAIDAPDFALGYEMQEALLAASS
jgi:hypothetical protein